MVSRTQLDSYSRTGPYASALRAELSIRARAYAEKYHVPHCESYGREPVICFQPTESSHGNFLPQTYRAILASAQWRSRLHKPHTSAKSAFPRGDYSWRELDSCMSSDALLMNIFCFPRLLSRSQLSILLGVPPTVRPEFGIKARVPLANGRFDRTEIDMRLGDLLVEAKLTEADFQQKDFSVLERYRDFSHIFDRQSLPRAGNTYFGYQLIRNVLAAYAANSSFCVMIDARRPDLLELWYSIMRCISDYQLRVRCQVITWQELDAALPKPLQRFLQERYGISGAARQRLAQ